MESIFFLRKVICYFFKQCLSCTWEYQRNSHKTENSQSQLNLKKNLYLFIFPDEFFPWLIYHYIFIVLFMTYCPMLVFYDNRVFCCKMTSSRWKPEIFLEMGVCLFWPRRKKPWSLWYYKIIGSNFIDYTARIPSLCCLF